ncbi:tetratricopeptide (TPR) repeat protein [Deinobacterium chartae]|uniref:Tetratricopeptide (TPR) repeat protein n=1 Tax=Deinobacterium chartae TaxID=521158 RepID=A0A841I4W2_9DEIO|nr:hypothetical protein [Deinobacterium chartae]MBB6100056.1 tetratricopeptide (TPR) repeat protein [Deinobacterium chartae]
MRKMLLTLVLSLASLAMADSLSDARTAFAKGDAAEATKIALELNTAESLALAARATTLGANLLPASQREAQYEKAADYARKAIALDDKNADAHFELARALGRLAQFKGVLQSLGLSGEVKSNLDRAIALDPKLAGAYVALGLWHANVPFIAGGRSDQVTPMFAKAITLEPNVIIHRLEYANALMTLSKRNRENAVKQLERAVKLQPRDFWEQKDLENAKKLLASLK